MEFKWNLELQRQLLGAPSKWSWSQENTFLHAISGDMGRYHGMSGVIRRYREKYDSAGVFFPLAGDGKLTPEIGSLTLKLGVLASRPRWTDDEILGGEVVHFVPTFPVSCDALRNNVSVDDLNINPNYGLWESFTKSKRRKYIIPSYH